MLACSLKTSKEIGKEIGARCFAYKVARNKLWMCVSRQVLCVARADKVYVDEQSNGNKTKEKTAKENKK